MYGLWPLPHILLVCTTLVCVLFVATHSYELGVHVYCLWPLLFVCLTIVLMCIVYTTPITLVNYTPTSKLPIHVSYNSVSVYYFYYYMLKLYLRRGESLDECLSLEAGIFSQCSLHTSCANRAQLASGWSTGNTCTVCGHPTMSNYFTMYSYKIVAVVAFQLSLLLFK